jgi:hypothetical protein
MGLYSIYNQHRKKNKMTKKYKKDADKKIMTGTNVYVFHNIVTDIQLFVNATNSDQAMEKFDQCGFELRSHWKIFLELDQQPTDGPNES